MDFLLYCRAPRFRRVSGSGFKRLRSGLGFPSTLACAVDPLACKLQAQFILPGAVNNSPPGQTGSNTDQDCKPKPKPSTTPLEKDLKARGGLGLRNASLLVGTLLKVGVLVEY